jgi:hypothetical protein
MRKLMMVVAMLAVLAVAALPAIAQVSETFSEKRITSGKASPSDTFSNKGDNVNACPTVDQDVNTGNIANEQGLVQYRSTAGDVGFDGSQINLGTPDNPITVTPTCTQTMDQAAAG